MNWHSVRQIEGDESAPAPQPSARHAEPVLELLHKTHRLQHFEGLVRTTGAERQGTRSGDGENVLAVYVKSPGQARAAIPVATDASTDPFVGREAGPLPLGLMPALLRYRPAATRVQQIGIARRRVVEPAAPGRCGQLAHRRFNTYGSRDCEHAQRQQAAPNGYQSSVEDHDCDAVWHIGHRPSPQPTHTPARA